VISSAGIQTIETKMAIQPDPLSSLRGIPSRLIAGLHDFCFWFSLPLAIWLSSGWIGLLFHWRADLDAARLWRVVNGKLDR